jgi:hypothetical protein
MNSITDINIIRQRVAASKIVYLDIETTGLNKTRDVITVVSISAGGLVKQFVRGENLDDFVPFLDANVDKAICGFNGVKFDFAFIESTLGYAIQQDVIDAMVLAHEHLHIKGGLKDIRKRLGWYEMDELATGLDAVWLWNMYQREKDPKYKTALLEYNAEDVESLEHVLVELCNEHAKQEGMGELLAVPTRRNRVLSPVLQEIIKRRIEFMAKLRANCPYVQYTETGRVKKAALIPDTDLVGFMATETDISTGIMGSQGDSYQILIEATDKGTSVHCSCPDFNKNASLPQEKRVFCKHTVKALQHAPPSLVAELFKPGILVVFY